MSSSLDTARAAGRTLRNMLRAARHPDAKFSYAQ